MRKLFTCLLGAVILTAGCQTGAIGGASDVARTAQVVPDIVWPKPPAAPRVRYLRAVSTPADAGIRRSLFGKIIDVVAGNSEVRFIRPTGVAEESGVMYVADPGAQALWILDTGSQQTITVRKAGDYSLVAPVALTPGKHGQVFVADSVLRRIFLFDSAGKLLSEIADPELKRPAALAYSPVLDRLYVADSTGQEVVVYSGSGVRLLSWGRRGSADGEFNFPSYIAFAGTSVIVTDALNYRIQAFDKDGTFLWKVGREGDGSGDMAAPKGIASDLEGHLYVVDGLFDAVQIFDHEGALLLAFGSHGSTAGEFSLPTGAFIDERDRIYVADSYNHRVQVFEFIAHPPAGQQSQTAQR